MGSSADIDTLWDYSRPDLTEARFREALTQIPESDPLRLELLTQVARAQGLQGNFPQAHETLDGVEQQLAESPSRAKVRYLLERGRVHNSSGEAGAARVFFEQALDLARQLREDSYAIDALHMLAIVAPEADGLALNLQAIEMAEASEQARARSWLGSLYNNTGWSYHELGEYATALAMFEKAEEFYRLDGRQLELRIAAWTVARALRSLGRLEEALARQMALKDELESAGETDGFVFEEIGECLLRLNRGDEAAPYFARAYELLSQEKWLVEQDASRLERLKQLGSA